MSDEPTLPTTQTLLDEMRAGFAAIDKRFESVEARLAGIEHQLEQMDIRADRLEGNINKSLSELFHLRADFKEFKSDFKQPT